LHRELARSYIPLGITSFLSQISLAAAIAAILNMLHKYGALDEVFSLREYAQIPMAVVGIVMKFFQIVISVVVGMLPLACVNKAAFIYLQSLGRARASASLSMLREVVFGVGFALLLPLFWSLDGILYSMPVSDVITFAASLIVIFNTYKAMRAI
jgi:hypothetical protein